MPTIHNGQEYMTLEEWKIHMDEHIEQTAQEIPRLLRKRQEKINNHDLYV